MGQITDRYNALIAAIEVGDSLDMENWQGGGGEIQAAASTLKELHSCGNSACIAGYVALLPEFASFGGSCSRSGCPVIERMSVTGSNAVAEWLEMDSTLCHALIRGPNRTRTPELEKFVDCKWRNWGKEEAIKLLKALRDGVIK